MKDNGRTPKDTAIFNLTPQCKTEAQTLNALTVNILHFSNHSKLKPYK